MLKVPSRPHSSILYTALLHPTLHFRSGRHFHLPPLNPLSLTSPNQKHGACLQEPVVPNGLPLRRPRQERRRKLRLVKCAVHQTRKAHRVRRSDPRPRVRTRMTGSGYLLWLCALFPPRSVASNTRFCFAKPPPAGSPESLAA